MSHPNGKGGGGGRVIPHFPYLDLAVQSLYTYATEVHAFYYSKAKGVREILSFFPFLFFLFTFFRSVVRLSPPDAE